jgi:outer membrane protein TolC
MRIRKASVPAGKFPLYAAWFAVGLLLAGCAQLPDWQGKASLDQPVPETLSAASAAARMDWPQDQWWQRYGSEQLNGLIAEALQGAPDMAAAAARVRQAQALLGVSESAGAPQLSANASIVADKQSYNYVTPVAGPVGQTPRSDSCCNERVASA